MSSIRINNNWNVQTIQIFLSQNGMIPLIIKMDEFPIDIRNAADTECQTGSWPGECRLPILIINLRCSASDCTPDLLICWSHIPWSLLPCSLIPWFLIPDRICLDRIYPDLLYLIAYTLFSYTLISYTWSLMPWSHIPWSLILSL